MTIHTVSRNALSFTLGVSLFIVFTTAAVAQTFEKIEAKGDYESMSHTRDKASGLTYDSESGRKVSAKYEPARGGYVKVSYQNETHNVYENGGTYDYSFSCKATLDLIPDSETYYFYGAYERYRVRGVGTYEYEYYGTYYSYPIDTYVYFDNYIDPNLDYRDQLGTPCSSGRVDLDIKQ